MISLKFKYGSRSPTVRVTCGSVIGYFQVMWPRGGDHKNCIPLLEESYKLLTVVINMSSMVKLMQRKVHKGPENSYYNLATYSRSPSAYFRCTYVLVRVPMCLEDTLGICHGTNHSAGSHMFMLQSRIGLTPLFRYSRLYIHYTDLTLSSIEYMI